MSRYRIIPAVTAFSLLLLLGACAQKEGTPLMPQEIKIVEARADDNATRFDTYAIIAMDAYERQDFATASRFFEKLYDIDPRKEYLIDAIKSASMVKDFDRVKHLIEKGKGEFGNDRFINRYLVAYYLDKREIDKAQEIVKQLLREKPTEKDYELAGILASVQGETARAKHYFQKAYRLTHSPKALLRLSDLLIRNGQSDEAIRLMETHTSLYGCDKAVCSVLVQIYTERQDVDALERLYKKLYLKTKEPLYANALLELWVFQKQYDKGIAFVKRHHLDKEILLDLYTAKKDYKHGYKTAMALYQERNDPKFLAKAAILEYEGSRVKSSKLMQSVIRKFEQSVYQLDDPLYYNYYAYLLIDHDIDIKKGIELVRKALAKEPHSLYYIDTLAWGYYKEGKCAEAWKLMHPFEQEQEAEIVEHIQKIKKCLKEKTE